MCHSTVISSGEKSYVPTSRLCKRSSPSLRKWIRRRTPTWPKVKAANWRSTAMTSTCKWNAKSETPRPTIKHLWREVSTVLTRMMNVRAEKSHIEFKENSSLLRRMQEISQGGKVSWSFGELTFALVQLWPTLDWQQCSVNVGWVARNVPYRRVLGSRDPQDKPGRFRQTSRSRTEHWAYQTYLVVSNHA